MKNKLGKIVVYIILTLLVGVTLYSYIMGSVLKKDYSIFGYTYYMVVTGSMEPEISTNDIIIVKKTDKLLDRDIITYRSGKNTVTHRIINISGDFITTKGDANNTIDNPINKNSVIGKVILIISPALVFKGLIILLIFIIFIVILNFDRIYDSIFVKNSREIRRVPEDVFTSPKEIGHSGLTVTIPLDEIENIKNITNNNIVTIEDRVNIIDVDNNDIVTKTNTSDRQREAELLKIVNDLLRAKNSRLSTTRITKRWLSKYHYVYKLALISLYQDKNHLVDIVEHPDFKEIYDYDLVKIGLYENLRNRIYEMPIQVFLKILVFCILYNDEEFFDGIFKIMKYKILVDKEDKFRVITNKNHLKELKDLINFMERIPDKFDNKNVFELEKIERLVKIKSYVTK